MKKKYSLNMGVIALICLGSFVILANSQTIINGAVFSYQSLGFSARANTSKDKEIKNKGAKNQTYQAEEKEIPERILWFMVFKMDETIEKEAQKLFKQGKDGNIWKDYFKREAKISGDQALVLQNISRSYLEAIKPLDLRAKKIIEQTRATFPKENISKAEIPKPPAKLKELQNQKDDLTLRHRDDFKLQIGEEDFGKFMEFVEQKLAKGFTSGTLELPAEGLSPQGWYAISRIYWDDGLPYPVGTGDGLTIFDYDVGFYYDPYVLSGFGNATTNQLYSVGEDTGYADIFPAAVYHPWFVTVRANWFCTVGDHWALAAYIPVAENKYRLRDYSARPKDGLMTKASEDAAVNFTSYDVYLAYTEICHFVDPDPCDDNLGEKCPKPTPTPTPTVSITPIEIVEKHGKKDVSVTVQNNANGSTRFKLSTVTGTGLATFDNGSTEVIVNGNVMNHSLTVKGVTESDRLENIRIEARLNSDTNVSAEDDFTVAYVKALYFENINGDDIKLDENPGNGRTDANTNIGYRIFPGKTAPGNNTDRSVVRVIAEVLPNVPGIAVYFASYDLDDPSADGLPVDGTDTAATPANGNDNNGKVNMSKSGELINPDMGNCKEQEIINDVSRIKCVTGTKAAKANYRVTMQPGDNFALAASVDKTYRDAIMVNPSAGLNLINNANQTISISGEPNPNNVQGIRTDMLTVWRKLHIEKDSMGNVGTANNIMGTIAQNMFIPGNNGVRNVNVTTNPSVPLEVNRFQLGRIIIDGTVFYINSNTANSVEIINPYRRNMPITQNSPFTLYDDDDYNADDSTIANGQITRYDVDGDDSEAINQLPDSFAYLQNADGVDQNMYASAYIKPDYDWAQNSMFNQTNLTFSLNIAGGNNLDTVINANRNSSTYEDDDFWVAYFYIAYQGELTRDADGQYFNNQTMMIEPEPGVAGLGRAPTNGCDCYLPGMCVGTSCNSVIPKGAFGSLIFQEVMQDVTRTWLLSGTTIQNQGTTAPHELGHQFGLEGDNKDPNNPMATRSVATYKVMDYPHRPTEMDEFELHPEHINIIRKRVTSPGE